MATTGRLDLSVWRNDDVYEFPLRVRGPNLTGVVLRAQIRLGPDVPGSPLVDLATVTNGNAEGIRLANVAQIAGVWVNDLRIRLNKSTRQGLPYSGEIGDAMPLAWAFQIAGRTRLDGRVNILAHVIDSDAAPLNRPAGIGIALSRQPAAGATLTINNDEIVELIIDGADLVAIETEKATDAATRAESARTTLTDAFPRAASLALFDAQPADELLPIVADIDGRILLGVRQSDGGIVGNLGATGTPAPLQLLADAERVTRLANGWNGLISYGQSLAEAIGTGGIVYSVSQPYANLTFGGGTRNAKAGNNHNAVSTGAGTSTVKPLVEQYLAVGGSGTDGAETHCSGAANWACTLAASDDAIDPATFVIFASAPGHGGYPIQYLDKSNDYTEQPGIDGPWYQNLLDHVREAKARATEAGKAYAVHAISWMQGESNAGDGSFTAIYNYYVAKFNQLVNDMDADIRAITGQTTPVHTLTYQVPTNGNQGNPATGLAPVQLAQLQVCRTNPLAHLVSPIYHLMDGSADGVHISALRQLHYGRYVGRAYKQLVIDGCVPARIEVVSATVKGAMLTVRFDVPQQPLVLDAAFLSLATDFGFKVRDDTGPIALSDIRADGDSVIMTLARAPAANPVVRYALDYPGTATNLRYGTSGNLRDSTPDTFALNGTTHHLWHVCPHFEQPILKLENA